MKSIETFMIWFVYKGMKAKFWKNASARMTAKYVAARLELQNLQKQVSDVEGRSRNEDAGNDSAKLLDSIRIIVREVLNEHDDVKLKRSDCSSLVIEYKWKIFVKIGTTTIYQNSKILNINKNYHLIDSILIKYQI